MPDTAPSLPRTERRRLAGWLAALLLPIALGGCMEGNPFTELPMAQAIEATPYRQIAATAIWTDEPAALIGLQRELPGETEQMVALANETTLRGDNFLLMIAHHRGADAGTSLRLEEFIKRVGGVPYPFGTISDNGLRRADDTLGTYLWAEYRSGGTTNCVLGLRRISIGARILPGNANSMDVLLRNCVNGSIDTALLPLRDTHLGAGPAGLPTGANAGRMLSPLAGPEQ